MSINPLCQAEALVKIIQCYAEYSLIRGLKICNVGNGAITFDPDILFPGSNCRFFFDFTVPYFICSPHSYRDQHLAKEEKQGTEYQPQNKDRLEQIKNAHPTTFQGYYLITVDH